jgi:hypothetical protein
MSRYASENLSAKIFGNHLFINLFGVLHKWGKNKTHLTHSKTLLKQEVQRVVFLKIH